MKSLFTDKEIASLAKTIEPNHDLSLRINKCGNIDVKHALANEIHFVFYKRKDGFFIRRRIGVYRGCWQHGGIMNGGKHFSTMKEMNDYFSRYMEKYPEHLIYSYEKYYL